jgi:sialic acid synthase SpsE
MVERPKIVAELSINHLGMVNIAKKSISSAQECGADFVKLKIKDVREYYGDATKRWRNFSFKDYRQSLELSEDDFKEIDAHCAKIGIRWFSTIHDQKGLDFISSFDVPFFKIASMDADKADLVDSVIEMCKSRSKPLVVSLGGKSNDFADSLIRKIKGEKVTAYVLHTVSLYPTPSGKSNVRYVQYLKDRYEDDLVKIGYSGHEEGFAPTLAAVAMGAGMVERHFSLSMDLKIHHIRTALTPVQFKMMTDMVGEIVEEMGSETLPFDPDELRFLEGLEYE